MKFRILGLIVLGFFVSSCHTFDENEISPDLLDLRRAESGHRSRRAKISRPTRLVTPSPSPLPTSTPAVTGPLAPTQVLTSQDTSIPLVTSAQSKSDLDLIPKNLPKKKAAIKAPVRYRPKVWSSTIFLEGTETVFFNRQNLVVPVPASMPLTQGILSLDFRGEVRPEPGWSFNLSDRFDYIREDDIPYPSQGNYRNDLRELYVTDEISPGFFIQAGRVNTRNGVALGYNPTDFFKPRSAVAQASIDPSALRENRLGVVQIQAQKIYAKSAFTAIAAPAVQSITPMSFVPTATLDPRLGQTNNTFQWLFGFSTEFADISPQLLVFGDSFGTHGGVNISHVFGSSIVGYAEWAGVNQPNLTTRAMQFGQKTNTLPVGLPNLPQVDTSVNFQSDVSVGGSWASASKFTINLEYHYHQSGFNQADFNNWVNWGTTNPLLAGQLWFIRQYAADQQEPLMQNEVFVRFDYPDVFTKNLNLDLIAFINPYDGSSLLQFASQYFCSSSWTFSAYVTEFLGGSSTEKGSFPLNTSASLKFNFYF